MMENFEDRYETGINPMTTNEKITVTADGVTYERGEKVDLFKHPIPEWYFERTYLCHLDKYFNDGDWDDNITVYLLDIYQAIPIQLKAPEWVQIWPKLDLSDRYGMEFDQFVDYYNAVLFKEAIPEALQTILKSPRVKIQWTSGEVEYEYDPRDKLWLYDGVPPTHYHVTPCMFECAVRQALEQRVPVFVRNQTND